MLITPAPIAPPGIELDDDRQTLRIIPGRFAPTVTEATVTIGPPLEDLADNKFDQVPGLDGNQVFELKFSLPSAPSIDLGSVENGGGIVSQAGYAYAVDRSSDQVKVFDLESSFNGGAAEVASIQLPGYPRDIALIPRYAYQPSLHDPPRFGDLIAVV